jgi:hypothetical protein
MYFKAAAGTAIERWNLGESSHDTREEPFLREEVSCRGQTYSDSARSKEFTLEGRCAMPCFTFRRAT